MKRTQPLHGPLRRRVPGGDMTVDVRCHQFAGVIGADNLHGQIIILDLREQGGHLQQFQGIVAESDGDIGIDDTDVVVDRIRRAFGQLLLRS